MVLLTGEARGKKSQRRALFGCLLMCWVVFWVASPSCQLPPHPCVRCLVDDECPGEARCLDGFCRSSGDLHRCRARDTEFPSGDGGPDQVVVDASCRPGLQRSCYTGPTGTLGVAPCRAGTQTCEDNGRWGVCLGDRLPSQERCNDVDDDCDGDVDEGFQQKGAQCQIGRGLCLNSGRLVCDIDQQSLRCDAEAGKPASETCDNQDEDCDGLVDEEVFRPCYRGPVNTQGKGVCRAGVEACADGSWGPCQGDRLPQTERCNSVDDNCDGQVDELSSCSCTAGASRECFQADPAKIGQGPCKRGVQLCDSTTFRWGPCIGEVTPKTERCDNVDNDCDGTVDESDILLGTACFLAEQKGRCQEGAWICSGGALDCQQKEPPKAEDCDGQDEDCDGSVDEDDPRRGELCQVFNRMGRCAEGRLQCRKGQRLCEQTTQAQAETCNGLDDDCDGKTDESCEWALTSSGEALRVRDIVIDGAGQIVLLLTFRGDVELFGRKIANPGTEASAIVKLSGDGILQWLLVVGLAQDKGGGDTILRQVAVDNQDNLYVTGSFSGQTQVEQTRLTSKGGEDVLLLYVSARGKPIWSSALGGQDMERATSVVWDANRGLFLAGEFQGQMSLGGRTNTSLKGSQDVWVVRLLGQSQVDWLSPIGGEQDEKNPQLVRDQSGQLYVAAEFTDTMEINANIKLNAVGGTSDVDVFVAQLSPSGGFLWGRSIGGNQEDRLALLRASGFNSIYVGMSFQDDLDLSPLLQLPGRHVAVFSFDQLGQQSWVSTFAGKGDSSPSGGAVRGGALSLTGVFQEEIIVGSLRAVGSAGKETMWWSRIGSTGKASYLRVLGSSESMRGEALAVDAVGNLIVVGTFSGNLQIASKTFSAQPNITHLFLAKMPP